MFMDCAVVTTKVIILFFHLTIIECAVLMNRDYNAAINIRQNLLYYINHEKWDSIFQSNQTLNKAVSQV